MTRTSRAFAVEPGVADIRQSGERCATALYRSGIRSAKPSGAQVMTRLEQTMIEVGVALGRCA
jgi:hypothetical protein